VTAPYRKKLIEVALRLEAINVASAKEKEPFTVRSRAVSGGSLCDSL
jgi:hypothetical protein